MVHSTAIKNAKLFFDTYVEPLDRPEIVEIGSQDVNGGVRDIFTNAGKYTGLDFAVAKGVDIVLDDPYSFPLPDGAADVVVCSSCFEHSEFFWLTFVEGVRLLRPGGLFYLNAPSNGPVHGYPVDCWRFYPDAGKALRNWAVRQGHDVVLLESYTAALEGGYFSDFVSVFLKDSSRIAAHPRRIQSTAEGYENGYVHGQAAIANRQNLTEDQRMFQAVQRLVKGRLKH